MQAFFGSLIFIIVCVAALVLSFHKTEGVDPRARIILLPAWFAGIVAAVYCGMAVLGGILWVFAWIGIYLRYVGLWLIGMVLHPWHWVF